MTIMKKLFFSFLLLLATATFSQGNLQFNQVIMFDLPASGTVNITVPVGKVWKIESVGNGGSSPYTMLRNAAVQNIAQFGAATGTSSTPLPFWLPTGFTGSFLANSINRTCISILEFNVVP